MAWLNGKRMSVELSLSEIIEYQHGLLKTISASKNNNLVKWLGNNFSIILFKFSL